MTQHADLEEGIISVPTPHGNLRVRAVSVGAQVLLVATSDSIPDIPFVRFHSSCVFGEALHAVDCDCGAQLDAAIEIICRSGGILVYAWEEGRGTGIRNKISAIFLQQSRGLSTADAFGNLGYEPEPRNFGAHIEALREVFSGNHVHLASRNPEKISALEKAGFVVERVRMGVAMTPERREYIEHKQTHLGHLNDD
jgi:GTP cyclohydrolase II